MSAAKTQQRISFSTVKNRVPYPDLLEVQLKSFRDFFQMDKVREYVAFLEYQKKCKK